MLKENNPACCELLCILFDLLLFSFCLALWNGEVPSQCIVWCVTPTPSPLTQPLIMMPTACWKLDWEELEVNNDNFYALCHLLREKASNLTTVCYCQCHLCTIDVKAYYHFQPHQIHFEK